jgi:hypothetical protein
VNHFGATLPTATVLLFVVWANPAKQLHFYKSKVSEKVCGAEQRRGLSTKLRVPTFVFAITLTF